MVDFTSSRNSLKISVNLLYYLTFYYQYINVNVGVVQAGDDHISDKEDFINLPIVYNYNHECFYKQYDNLNSCDRAWHMVKGIEVTGEELNYFEDLDLESCYQRCLNIPTCVAVRRLFAYSDNKCWLHKQGFKEVKNDKYITHFLKCCTLEQNLKSLLDFQNLPIVSNPEESCSSGNNPKNKFQAFHHIERRTFNGKAHLQPRVKHSFECMNMCLEEPLCKAYQFHVDSQFDVSCIIYTKGDVNSEDNRFFHVFKKIPCNVYNLNLWSNKRTNLLMLHQPSKVCDKFSTTKVRNCNLKFWHVEDELRMKGHYKEIHFDQIQNCLNECMNQMKCIGISVEWSESRCLLFESNSFTKYYGQKKWSSFILSCCKNMRNTNLPHSTVIKNFQSRNGIKKFCKDSDANVKSEFCPHKYWNVEFNARLLKPIKYRGDLNLQECLHYCWLTADCRSISVKSNQNDCYLHGFNAEKDSSNKAFRSFYLSCCHVDPETLPYK